MDASKVASVVGLLVFGTVVSVTSKLVYDLQSENLNGDKAPFRKPWAVTTTMFLAMSLCLPIGLLGRRETQAPRAQPPRSADEPLLPDSGEEEPAKRSELRDIAMLVVPTALDLTATALMSIGLLSVTASVYQMLRGTEMLFAAAMAVLFLKRRLNRFHYGGLACCVVGITLVGVSSVLAGHSTGAGAVSQAQIVAGMGLIVLSQLVQAAQITCEDYFMSELQIAPLKIVGYEGGIGTLLCVLLITPVLRVLPGEEGDGLHEDIFDTLHMVTHSAPLAAVLLLNAAALLGYNFVGMRVTGQMGAVFRTVLETMRTLFVWLVDLALFYALRSGLGEEWNKYSYVQAAGFAVLVAGTVVYSRGEEEGAREDAEQFRLSAREGVLPAAVTPLGRFRAAGVAAMITRAYAPRFSHAHAHPTYSMAAGGYKEALAKHLRAD